jgi:hypothetical protein
VGPQCSVCNGNNHDSDSFDPNNHVGGCREINIAYTDDMPDFSDTEGLLRYIMSGKLAYTVTIGNYGCPSPTMTSQPAYAKVSSDYSCTEGGTLTLTVKFKESWAGTITDWMSLDPIGYHTFGDPVVTPPTATKEGYTSVTCTLCGEKTVSDIVPALGGHTYGKKVIVAPTCLTDGYTERTCTSCGHKHISDIVPAAGLHWFGAWTANGETAGIHNAACRNEGCTHIGKAACAAFEVTVGDSVLSVCPVCGQFGEAAFEIVKGASMTSATKMMLPMGEALVRGIADPFDGVLYAFTASYEYSGESIPFGTTVSVSVPLSGEQFASFELLRVDVTPATETEERTEVRTAVEYTYENGVLTFEADSAALYLIVAPSLQ